MNERLRHWILKFGRLDDALDLDDTEHKLDALDGRMTSLEREQRDIAARLQLLEYQANPRGRFTSE